ncbi:MULTISPECIES: 3',5'-nucleoside bisphosphate phosphatase [unclassified Herbaspirillum]|uniref:3',5'-nucleoside bisphosphate phosphatase n=1 Tax=Herbaspirillum TaxID=963 RepID=UPI000C095F46|nr:MULTISPECIES: 3',5'-nucleoside bisphosphate phosphatase [unclassified Herbaspirillum]MAF02663.1 phosphatase [Herbaspirillum sp.]MBO14388.1 phosphatase [Herbaspirillum sp.]|tara:strand:+ start:105 stop:947 length:843 start_codon:yes stop_codon:yes gene_type:complete
MSELKFDLHCHSNVSDGLLPPEEVAARAKANGVGVWALTDHDEVGGVARARAAARALGMEHVAGVEISVTWAGHTVHIVGLRIDETNQALVDGLAATRNGRERRAREIAEALDRHGICGAYEGALKHVGNPDLISRTHFARYLVECGTCCDTKEVFANYLTEGKPGYVPHRWATLEESVRWIRGAGGVAVIAHPGRYKYTQTQFGALFDEFKQLGGAAIEVNTGSHTPEQYQEYAQVARSYGFLASMGSDFHGPGESRMDLGGLPPLPTGVKPVWHDWGL